MENNPQNIFTINANVKLEYVCHNSPLSWYYDSSWKHVIHNYAFGLRQRYVEYDLIDLNKACKVTRHN